MYSSVDSILLIHVKTNENKTIHQGMLENVKPNTSVHIE